METSTFIPSPHVNLHLKKMYSSLHPFFSSPAAPSPSLHPGARPGLLRPPLWCGGLAGAFWCHVDAWVSSGPGVWSGCYVC
jgi:hypothetical protein